MSHIHFKREQKRNVGQVSWKQILRIYSLPSSKEQVGFYIKWDEEGGNYYTASFCTEGLELDRFKLKITI